MSHHLTGGSWPKLVSTISLGGLVKLEIFTCADLDPSKQSCFTLGARIESFGWWLLIAQREFLGEVTLLIPDTCSLNCQTGFNPSFNWNWWQYLPVSMAEQWVSMRQNWTQLMKVFGFGEAKIIKLLVSGNMYLTVKSVCQIVCRKGEIHSAKARDKDLFAVDWKKSNRQSI